MERKAVSNEPVPLAVVKTDINVDVKDSATENTSDEAPRTGGGLKEKMKARVEEEEGGVARTGGGLKEKMKARVEEEEGGVTRTDGGLKEKMKARVEEEEGGVARTDGVLKEKMKAGVEEEEGGVADEETTEASGSGRDGTTYHRGRLMTAEEKYAIQCKSCYKWRIILTKEKYQDMGSRIHEHPFVCANAQEWMKDITCDDPADLDEDDRTLVWAIDKYNIPVPPENFRREIILRAKKSTQFADTYYTAPCGKILNSGIQAQKYLAEHPNIRANISQFSFTIPISIKKLKANRQGQVNP